MSPCSSKLLCLIWTCLFMAKAYLLNSLSDLWIQDILRKLFRESIQPYYQKVDMFPHGTILCGYFDLFLLWLINLNVMVNEIFCSIPFCLRNQACRGSDLFSNIPIFPELSKVFKEIEKYADAVIS